MIEGGKGREGGRKEGREGGFWSRHGYAHISMPVVVSIHSVELCWREGLRAVRR